MLEESHTHTPSAPPAANIYTIPDYSTGSDKPPDVSFNPPTYEEATTVGNVDWDTTPGASEIVGDVYH